MTDMTPREALDVLEDLQRFLNMPHVPLSVRGNFLEARTTLSALADRAGDDRKGFRTEGMDTTFAEYLTEFERCSNSGMLTKSAPTVWRICADKLRTLAGKIKEGGT